MMYKSTEQDIDIVNKILYNKDPIGIAIPDDEYSTEAEIIAYTMRSMKNIEEMTILVYHTFAAMFTNPGDIPQYREIACSIWNYIYPSDTTI